ncbi:MBL fold metallo-hydrolase [Paenibacillus sp. L3-i20]|uniref:MBL fold metallo-hydrolase n=1 Tax=Paenibacillus sp. L3-i20 TaxID=2905833 RepID=UPI001EDE7FE7|nr:MBL fold metallo-hydrolase [Paenibacillus sp. L3-i20]GKU78799.1 hydrolase [Paenibacillus sp. L3-i20]
MLSESGIAMLSVSADIMGKVETLHPTLLWDTNEIIVVDSAYPGQLPLIKQELSVRGITIEEITRIIVTHQDLDHIGSIPALLEQTNNRAEIISSLLEKPYIQGEKMLIKLTPEAIDEAVHSLPENVPPKWRAAFKHTLSNPPRFPVDTIVSHLEELPYCGGIVALDTPGHTPGHISLYHKTSKTLIAGDALKVVDHQLFLPDPKLCSNYEQAKQSIEQFLHYDVAEIICYHGGKYTTTIHERLRELVYAN